MDDAPYSGRFTELLMEGLGHYRRGALEQAMASWEGAYHVEAGNPQAQEFLRTALLRLQVKLGRDDGRAHPWLSDLEPQTPPRLTQEPDDGGAREIEAGCERGGGGPGSDGPA